MVDNPKSMDLKLHQYYVIAVSALSVIGERTKSLDQIHLDMSNKYPAFSEKYLKDFSGSNPKWLTKELMLTKNLGKKDGFSGPDLWRKWGQGKAEIVNKWNPLYSKFIVNGLLPSGKSTDDVILMVYCNIIFAILILICLF